jgi:hypothetical protein
MRDERTRNVPALITALLLGLRHGSDIDHVAAIFDLTATEGRRLARLPIVHCLRARSRGSPASVRGRGGQVRAVIPEAVDGLMGRVIGFTLIALALYVVVGFMRFGRTWQPRSRGSLIWHAAHRRLHRHDIDHDASTAGALVIGMIQRRRCQDTDAASAPAGGSRVRARRDCRVRGRAPSDEHCARCDLGTGPHAH